MKINRQSVIRDDTQKFNSKIKDKSKSRINYRNDDDMKEDIKEDSFGSQDKTIINKKHLLNNSKSRSYAFCRTNEEASYLVFSENDEIYMVSNNDRGKFYRICFDKNKKGETKIVEAFEILCEENLAHLGDLFA